MSADESALKLVPSSWDGHYGDLKVSVHKRIPDQLGWTMWHGGTTLVSGRVEKFEDLERAMGQAIVDLQGLLPAIPEPLMAALLCRKPISFRYREKLQDYVVDPLAVLVNPRTGQIYLHARKRGTGGKPYRSFRWWSADGMQSIYEVVPLDDELHEDVVKWQERHSEVMRPVKQSMFLVWHPGLSLKEGWCSRCDTALRPDGPNRIAGETWQCPHCGHEEA